MEPLISLSKCPMGNKLDLGNYPVSAGEDYRARDAVQFRRTVIMKQRKSKQSKAKQNKVIKFVFIEKLKDPCGRNRNSRSGMEYLEMQNIP